VEKLRGKGYNPSLYNARFIKPMDAELSAQLTKYKCVFTIEDAAKTGGYGSMLQTTNSNVNTFGLPDVFIGTGTRDELFNRHGLDSTSLAEKFEQIYKENSHD
jgi:1-deoxy-D-xylulose-5-phosphate synthase